MKKITLVLSGGGARGIAHIGVIEELENRGFEVASIAGTSMGALVGGVYALGKLPEFKDWLLALDKKETFRLLDFTFSKQGLIKADRVLERMKAFMPNERIEDLPIKFTVTATDIMNKEEVVFKDGLLFDAIRASIAVPSVITPVETENRILVDGGVINNLPIGNAIRTDDDILVAVTVNARIPAINTKKSKREKKAKETRYKRKVKVLQDYFKISKAKDKKSKIGYFNILINSYDMMLNRLQMDTVRLHNPDIFIEVPHSTCSLFDFYRAEELVDIGRYIAAYTIDEYEKKVKKL
ncbi:MAG: patatin-like phospholipase family protein [Saprospiraceae bacterium]